MKAMVLTRPGLGRVEALEIDKPRPGPTQVLVRVLTCGVCRTDLHVVDGELPQPAIPVVPGHEIVGHVEAVGRDVTSLDPGTRVGIPWLGWACGKAIDDCGNVFEADDGITLVPADSQSVDVLSSVLT